MSPSLSSPASGSIRERLYTDLADWWPLLSPPEDYADEAQRYLELFTSALGQVPHSLLELGSGGGHLAVHLPSEMDLVLLDLAPAMLAASQRLNPTRRHVLADMRSCSLGRSFDAVLLHDAVMYLTQPQDLVATCRVAAAHLRTGGALLVLPDLVAETFAEGLAVGGGGPDWSGPDDAGRSARMMEWTWDPDPADSTYRVDMSFLLRQPDGTVQAIHDVHTMALHSLQTYWDCIRAAGLRPVEAPPLLAAQCPGQAFLAVKD
ncbi:MAG: class I SAM-dependent methyltransferase [Oligoflexia bacterium]|nr:class I SAM-dependent methyltransferase [Oligoflexia bacterium]